jgi:hypothetical protein
MPLRYAGFRSFSPFSTLSPLRTLVHRYLDQDHSLVRGIVTTPKTARKRKWGHERLREERHISYTPFLLHNAFPFKFIHIKPHTIKLSNHLTSIARKNDHLIFPLLLKSNHNHNHKNDLPLSHCPINNTQLLPPLHPGSLPLRHHPPRLRHGPPHVRNLQQILNRHAAHQPRHLEIQTPHRDLEPPGASARRALEQLGSVSAVRCGGGEFCFFSISS